MATQKTPPTTDEESKQRTDDYHHGADNSIKDVMRSIRDDRQKQGKSGSLSGVDDGDIQEIEDAGDGKTKPESQRKQEGR